MKSVGLILSLVTVLSLSSGCAVYPTYPVATSIPDQVIIREPVQQVVVPQPQTVIVKEPVYYSPPVQPVYVAPQPYYRPRPYYRPCCRSHGSVYYNGYGRNSSVSIGVHW